MFKGLSLKVLIFGFIFTFFSSFGQSFFLGLFNSSIRDALSISHGQFGTIYASATLCSSLLLIWVGKKIDDVNVFKFAFYVTILLSFSCFFFSKISSVIFLFIAIFLSIGFVLANFLAAPSNPDPEKLSAYECGFEAFDDSRMEFDVRFYLVAILFIIFDLEIAFLFPWAISLGKIGLFEFTSMMIFLFILTIGFIYEWKIGALDWE